MASALYIGLSLSHYRIISKIGEDGMGEVYLAEETKLDRKVAIKFLNEEFSNAHPREFCERRLGRILEGNGRRA